MYNKSAYIKGFCKAAKIYNKNPEELIKFAAESTPAKEVLLGGLPGMIPYVGPGASTIGGLKALLEDVDDEAKPHEGVSKNLIPGVANYRLVKRLKGQAVRQDRKHKGSAVKNLLGEILGPSTSIIGSTLAGSALGAGLNALRGRRASDGAITGALIGSGAGALSSIAGGIIAGIKRRRTAQEQVDHDKELRLSNYLVPGAAVYNRYKRLGRSQGDIDENPKNKKKTRENTHEK